MRLIWGGTSLSGGPRRRPSGRTWPIPFSESADLGLAAEDGVLSKDEKVECVDDWAGFGLSGEVESSQTGGVLIVGDQL